MRSTLNALPVQSMEILTTEELKQACAQSEPFEFGDPYLGRVEFNFQETFYPLGFPVNLSTNSSQVFEVAAECWSGSQKLFAVEPIELQIGVSEGTSSICPGPPVCRMKGHLACNIADAENFTISDYDQGFSFVWVTRAAMEHPGYFHFFFLTSTVMGQIANRYAWGIHAACVELQGAGVLLCGDSGAGKTTLSYACARAGWTYITDDGSYLVDGREDRLIAGDSSRVRFRSASESIFPELRGMPVLQRAEVGKPSIELATDSSRRLLKATAARVRHIVFLKRGLQRQELVPFPVEAARLYMLQRASLVPILRERQTKMFDLLLEGGALELRYTDLGWAVDRLSQLVREGY